MARQDEAEEDSYKFNDPLGWGPDPTGNLATDSLRQTDGAG